MYHFTVSVNQESGPNLAGSLAQGHTSLQLRKVLAGLNSIWMLTWDRRWIPVLLSLVAELVSRLYN